jgi:hypothetical protein
LNHLINFLRKRNDGYVSIEVVIIGGLIVGFGALTIDGFHQTGSKQVQNTVTTIDDKFSTPEMSRILDR